MKKRTTVLFVSLVLLVQLVFVGDSFAQAKEGGKGEKEAEQALQDFKKVIEGKETKPSEEAEEVLRNYDRARGRLLGLGKLATPVLVRAIKTKRFAEQFRGTCIDLLSKIGGRRAIEALIEVSKDETEIPRLREEALWMLGRCGGPEVLDVFLEALKDTGLSVRRGGVLGIQWLAARKVAKFPVDAVVELAKNDEEIWVRGTAVVSLGLGGEKAVPALLELMNDEDRDIRLQACASLGRIGDTRAVEPLIAKLNAKLNDREYYERHAAVIALGDIGDERAVEPLIKILNVEDADSRDAAEALAKIGDKRAIEALKIAIEEERKTFGKPSNHLLNAYKKLTGKEYKPQDGGSE